MIVKICLRCTCSWRCNVYRQSAYECELWTCGACHRGGPRDLVCFQWPTLPSQLRYDFRVLSVNLHLRNFKCHNVSCVLLKANVGILNLTTRGRVQHCYGTYIVQFDAVRTRERDVTSLWVNQTGLIKMWYNRVLIAIRFIALYELENKN